MKPNIVIIVLDAVRAQNLPFYGYHRNTMPFLSSMEHDLAIYENAISSSYWTLPSIASLFTGMYTSGHRLVTDGDKIDKSLLTLPLLLRQHGYRCAGFVRNLYVSDYSGLDSDFHDFNSEYVVDTLRRAASVISKKCVSRLQPAGVTRSIDITPNNWNSQKIDFYDVIARCFEVMIDRGSCNFVNKFAEWLKEYRTGPFFSYFHIFETHSPYRAPLKFTFKFLSLRDNIRKLFINHNHLKLLLGKCKMSPEDFQILQSAYDNSIYYADYLIRKIVQSLQKHGLYDETLIIILADHGDNIGDHGMMFHYFSLYDTLIKVPLLVKFPVNIDIRGRVSEVVQNIDIFPTILSFLEINDKKTWKQVQGNDLLGQASPKREQDLAISELVKVFGPDRRHYKEQLDQYNRRLLSVRTRDRKFIYSSREDHECYDLAEDPPELSNLYPGNDRFSDLEHKAYKYYEKMNNFYISNKEKIDGDVNLDGIDVSTIEQLKSLGYM